MKPVAVYAAVAIALAACTGSNGTANAHGDILAAVGKNTLTRTDLKKSMPGGMTPDDSTAFAHAFIKQWVEERLVENVASEVVDIDEINRLTAEYRLSLIMSQYRRNMATQAEGIFSQDSLRAYYESHKSDFVLERPLVRGVYLKIPDDAANLRTLRRLYTSTKDADMDRLEKEAPRTALHYDYFREQWIDWEQIETRIPTDITNPDTFLKAGKPLDISVDGFTYLLHISDYLPSGASLPFEAAEPMIRERLLTRNRRAYDAELLHALFDRAVSDGTLTFPAGNPL